MRCLDGISNSVDKCFERALGEGEGQGGLACCGPWRRKESDTTGRLNNHSLVSIKTHQAKGQVI